MSCKIKERREELGISQGKLADKIKCSREYINKIENNKIKNPGIRFCKRIADALWTSVDKLWV